MDLLDELGAARTQIDEPKFKVSIRQDLRPNVRRSTTFGCTAGTPTQWWKHEKSEDRYNYLYSAGELEPFVAAVKAEGDGGEEGVSVHEQSLFRKIGRQRGDDQNQTSGSRCRGSIQRSSSSAIPI